MVKKFKELVREHYESLRSDLFSHKELITYDFFRLNHTAVVNKIFKEVTM